ncbi:MAX [Cordylochernes scorpioides]|uniref:MAX n=1 Tax=Cordylochernes scorpioides TaxID=51811 RepID=A0ABY6KLM2_9ARAC|nr:MAX [Cordylochernes scorpioides]
MYSVGRRTKRWPLCLFFNFLDVVAINSAVIYKAVKQDGGMARKDFIKQLALQLMRDALNMRNQAKYLSRDLQVLIQKHAGTSSLELIFGGQDTSFQPAGIAGTVFIQHQFNTIGVLTYNFFIILYIRSLSYIYKMPYDSNDLIDDEEKDFDCESDLDKRAHHNALERKRRDHIKDSFTNLGDCLPTLRREKVSRAQILKKTADYIIQMEKKRIFNCDKEIKDLQMKNKCLEEEIRWLEKRTLLEGNVLAPTDILKIVYIYSDR